MNKGNYYKLKTRDWFKKKGYAVEIIEKMHRIYTGGKVIFIKRDVFGADIMACNDTETILANSVFGRANVAARIKEFKKYPNGGLKRWIVVWETRAQEPEIIEVDTNE